MTRASSLRKTAVFLLYHTYGPETDRAENLKLIGIYSSRANAKAAMERVKEKPGFRSRPTGFKIDSHSLDQDGWSEGFDYGWPDGSITAADE